MATGQNDKKARPNWKKIASEYITGDIAMCPLAKKHHVAERTLKDHAKRERWSDRRRDYRLKTAEEGALQGAPSFENFAPDEEDIEKVEKVFRAADLLIDRVIRMLEHDAWLDGKELSALATAISKCKEIRHLRDALDVREQEARIAALERSGAPQSTEAVQIEFVGSAGEAAV